MIVLFFTRRFWPEIGGVEKHVLEIGKRLVEKGHSVIVVTENHEYKSQEIVAGIQVYRINVDKKNRLKKFRIWQQLWNLRDIMQSADIIHCHDVFFWYIPFRLLFPTKPIYTTFHGYESYPLPKNAKLMHKLAEKLSWGNICIGDFIPKWYGTKPTVVSYGAVEKYPISNIQYPISNDCVFIGRLDDQTNILMYAKAVQIIRKTYPKFSFTIVGDGKYLEKVKHIGKTVGFKANPLEYLKKSNYAFVSRYLGMLEAMIEKKVVFAVFDNPIKKDYLLLSPFAKYAIIADSAEELAKQVKFFMQHPKEEKKIVTRAYSFVKQQTWDKLVSQYLTLWKSNRSFLKNHLF